MGGPDAFTPVRSTDADRGLMRGLPAATGIPVEADAVRAGEGAVHRGAWRTGRRGVDVAHADRRPRREERYTVFRPGVAETYDVMLPLYHRVVGLGASSVYVAERLDAGGWRVTRHPRPQAPEQASTVHAALTRMSNSRYRLIATVLLASAVAVAAIGLYVLVVSRNTVVGAVLLAVAASDLAIGPRLLPPRVEDRPLTAPDTPALRIGIVTVSDRAAAGAYEDLSGAAIRDCLSRWIASPWTEMLPLHRR